MNISESIMIFFKKKFPIKEIPVENLLYDDFRLVTKFSLLNPLLFLKVIFSNFIALILLYKPFKQENF